MAKATITLEDNPDGTVHVTFDFDPPLDVKNNPPPTPAQSLAFAAARTIRGDDPAELIDIDGTPAESEADAVPSPRQVAERLSQHFYETGQFES